MMVFLFSDIENSTWLWEHHTEAMWRVISRHDDILKERVTEHSGEIVKHTGDGVFVVFDEHGHPLKCAVAIQRQIDREDWGEIGELRIRMGLHAGHAERHSGDYFGPDVNRAARMLSVAKAGQILVTPEVLKVCTTPQGTVAKDLGVRMLKGIGQLQRVYRLVRADLVHVAPDDEASEGQESPEEPTSLEPYQCADCFTINLPNTLFCERCGHKLGEPADVRTSDLALRLMPSGQKVPLPDEEEILLGRGGASSQQPFLVDLGSIGGLAAGVSRRHASLTRQGRQLLIEDLGSTNGTYVNRRRINPHQPVAIDVGDTIYLGKLKVQIVQADSSEN